MTATNHSNDYFRLVDLNPNTTTLQPVIDPRDPRGQCWFGFLSQGQRLSLEFGTNPPPSGLRVLYSFDYDYFTGIGAPPPSSARVHGMFQMTGGPQDQDQQDIELHDREFVALWIDPTGVQPATGQTVQVSVKAWRQSSGRRDE